jgi:MFS family permease
MLTGVVHNLGGIIACRVILAIFEAGFGAGVPYYLSLAYKRRELGFRLSILLGSSPVANCISGAMAYGITQIKSPLEPWRLIFLIGMYTNSFPQSVQDMRLILCRGRSHGSHGTRRMVSPHGLSWHGKVYDRRRTYICC